MKTNSSKCEPRSRVSTEHTPVSFHSSSTQRADRSVPTRAALKCSPSSMSSTVLPGLAGCKSRESVSPGHDGWPRGRVEATLPVLALSTGDGYSRAPASLRPARRDDRASTWAGFALSRESRDGGARGYGVQAAFASHCSSLSNVAASLIDLVSFRPSM